MPEIRVLPVMVLLTRGVHWVGTVLGGMEIDA